MPKLDATIDYYATLGVPEKADAEAIKTAYRMLARANHPDVTAGDPVKEARFKRIATAYEVLGDAGKRAEYDRMRAASAGGGFPGISGDAFDLGSNLGNMFEQLFGPGAAQKAGEVARDGSRRHVHHRRTSTSTPPATPPDEMITKASDGTSLRVDGLDVHSDLRVRFDLAIVGTTATVATIEGKVEVKVPPGTSSGKKLRLRERGIDAVDLAWGSGMRGDHYVTVHIDIPENRDEAIRVLEQVTRSMRASSKR